MLINRWKKDKDKDKEKEKEGKSSTSSASNSSPAASSKSTNSGKKKRKSGKDDDDQKRTNTKEKGRSSSTGGKSRADEDKKSWSNRRDDPRRHTLSGDRQVNSNSVSRSMDLESPLSRGYPSSSNSMLFDDDPGIMSEVETSCTGFRRGNKQRSSLPVVRTPSKTLERPLGLVFLQYRNETKRSLLPNEITSLDTVKALFVRSFPRQLTMEYLDSPRVKIYIHDSNKDMFYELEDLRSHLNEIHDRTVLRLFESPDVGGAGLPPGLAGPPHVWDQDQSYFSEPEFDSEYQSQHIHKSKNSKPVAAQPYYMTHSFPPGSSSTLPRGGGGAFIRPYSPAVTAGPSAGKHSGYMSSPERAAAPPRGYSPYGRRMYDDIYTGQFTASRPSSITPIIDEEISDGELLDDSYNLYGVGVKLPPGPSTPRTQFAVAPPSGPPYDVTRIRVEHMERQLANLTGLVQKALIQVPPASPRDFNTSTDNVSVRSEGKVTKFGKDKSVSFEKSVSFSDEPPDMNSPVQHSPLHNADSKPSKPAIKSSTLPRTSSQEKERGKPIPPPKPLSLSGAQYENRSMYRDLQLTPEMYNQLRGLQKKTKDLRQELRILRRMSLAQSHTAKETMRDTFIKIRSLVLIGGESLWKGGADSNRINVSREEDIYKQEMIKLESDLTELETTVEELRGNVINRKSRVNMSDVENMALILSKSSKTVADLKLRFPALQEAIRSVITEEMERVDVEEMFLKDEPEKLEIALRRCKKLTGTLVTLKRLASVQEQRVPDSKSSPTADEGPSTPTTSKADRARSLLGTTITSGSREGRCSADVNRSENALDSLLDELQSFSKLTVGNSTTATLRRVNSISSENNRPPVPDRLNELTNKRIPPPPPPRTSSKSPLASPTNLSASFRLINKSPTRKGSITSIQKTSIKENEDQLAISNSSSCESVNSQEGIDQQSRQQQLELRHQELLRKQKALQEQYSRLQQLQRTATPLTTTVIPDVVQLKKTGSESNILSKMNLSGLSVASSMSMSGSLSHLGKQNTDNNVDNNNLTKTNKIYETDIL